MFLTTQQIEHFDQHGYVVASGLIDPEQINHAKQRFDHLFRGEFETGIQPDEWNWREGESPATHTRQICNGWKADRAVARLVLDGRVGQICAGLMNWPGTRLNQDNVIWKPPAALPLGFHQDDAYQDWIDPPSMISCWIALDDTRAEGGTIEYVRGSHHWPVLEKKFQFHAPQNYREGLQHAAREVGVQDYQIDPVEVSAGDFVLHHGATWHGSGANHTRQPRRSIVAHCMSSRARFHAKNRSAIYSRYQRFGSLEMDESFFPVTYTRDGYRSEFLDREPYAIGAGLPGP